MSNAVNVQVGSAIREFRESKLRITQAQLAERVGISRPSVANIEGGRQQLTVAQLMLFARVLGIHPVKLLPFDTNEFVGGDVVELLPEGTDAAIVEWAGKLMPSHG